MGMTPHFTKYSSDQRDITVLPHGAYYLLSTKMLEKADKINIYILKQKKRECEECFTTVSQENPTITKLLEQDQQKSVLLQLF